MKNTLSDILKQAIDYTLSQMFLQLPGIIIDFNAETKLATVQPSIKRRFLDSQVFEMPNIINVPVVFQQSQDFSDTYPLKRGDGVLLVFSQRSLERWIDNGHNSEPGNRRKFDLSDAIAIPGLFATNTPSNYDPNNSVRRFKNAIFKMQADGKIAIGNDQAELLDIINQLINAIKTATYGGNSLDNPAPFLAIQQELNKIKGTL